MKIIIIAGAISIFVIFVLLQACLLASLNEDDAVPPPRSLADIRRHAVRTAERRYCVLPVNPYAEGTWESEAWATEYRQALQTIQNETKRAL